MSKLWVVPMRLVIWVMILGWVMLAAGTQPVSAHAPEVVDARPKAGTALESAPAEVKVWFSEEIDPRSNLTVLDDQGQVVDLGNSSLDLNDPNHASMAVALPAFLSEGTYTVRWTVVLLDGDASEGEFSFIVGVASPTAAPASKMAFQPAWNLAGGATLIAIAGAVFFLYKRRPVG